MPVMKCILCSHQTNSIVSKYWMFEDGFAHGCFARLDKDGKWEKGCHYAFADNFEKTFADDLVNRDWEKQKRKNDEILKEN